jgi:hypothetical protein
MIARSNWMRALLVALAVAALAWKPVPAGADDGEKKWAPGSWLLGSGEEEGPPMIAVDPAAMKFAPIPDMPACATGAILRGNPVWGPSWVLLKLASNCSVPFHWHTANEDLIVIRGQGTILMKNGPPLTFVPGAYASLPSRHLHRASCVRECLLFASSDAAFDIHYVDDDGNEIDAEEALGSAERD